MNRKLNKPEFLALLADQAELLFESAPGPTIDITLGLVQLAVITDQAFAGIGQFLTPADRSLVDLFLPELS